MHSGIENRFFRLKKHTVFIINNRIVRKCILDFTFITILFYTDFEELHIEQYRNDFKNILGKLPLKFVVVFNL